MARLRWLGLGVWLAWSALDAVALAPVFRALPALYRAAHHPF